MNEYWWEMRVLRNISMHPEGLSQVQMIRNTGVEHDLVGQSLGYLAPNGYLDSELLFNGDVFDPDKDMPGVISDALDRLTDSADRTEKATYSIVPVYRINDSGLRKLSDYRRAYDSLNRARA